MVRWCYGAMVLGTELCAIPAMAEDNLDFFQSMAAFENRPEFKEAQAFAQSLKPKNSALQNCASQNHRTVAPSNRSTTYIFVSFSMGEAALQQYAAQAKKAGVALVFRGLVGDSMKTTVLRLQSLVQKTQASFLIDPPAFRRFGIQKVPAVVVAKDEHAWDVVYGLTTLDYALEKISKDGDAAASAALALQKFRGKTG